MKKLRKKKNPKEIFIFTDNIETKRKVLDSLAENNELVFCYKSEYGSSFPIKGEFFIKGKIKKISLTRVAFKSKYKEYPKLLTERMNLIEPSIYSIQFNPLDEVITKHNDLELPIYVSSEWIIKYDSYYDSENFSYECIFTSNNIKTIEDNNLLFRYSFIPIFNKI